MAFDDRTLDRGMERRLRRRSIQRTLLRAGNGAAVGALLGLIAGALLLPGFSAFTPGSDLLGLIATGVLGGCLGGCSGLLIGTTIVLRDDRRRQLAGTGIGLGLGLLLGPPLTSYVSWAGVYAPALIASGLIGGYAVSVGLSFVRKRWRWWTRWEE